MVTAGETLTVVVEVTLPAALVAVKVYVVVVAGETDCVPPSERLLPTPLLMLTVVALSTAHTSVEDWPAMMFCGDDENWMMRGSWPAVTVTDALHELLLPFAPLAITV